MWWFSSSVCVILSSFVFLECKQYYSCTHKQSDCSANVTLPFSNSEQQKDIRHQCLHSQQMWLKFWYRITHSYTNKFQRNKKRVKDMTAETEQYRRWRKITSQERDCWLKRLTHAKHFFKKRERERFMPLTSHHFNPRVEFPHINIKSYTTLVKPLNHHISLIIRHQKPLHYIIKDLLSGRSSQELW